MEFGVLGPLVVCDGDTLFSVGGPKQRTLLATLIAAGGAPVSTDNLLMGVYGPDAQPSSRRSLQTYVSMVRRELGDVVRREGDGYLLATDREAIDAARFEDAVVAARSTADDAARHHLLVESLGQWRGPAYADVELHDGLLAEAVRLEELRAEAFEARIELELEFGRHRDVVAELEAAIAEAPLRERLHYLHMVALYRSGRQADALRAYQDAATHLRDELGVDPSPELQDLEGRILRQDRGLDYRPRPRPRPLPARYTSFVGRDAEVETIASRFGDDRLVTLTGPGGIGKSSLGVEVARRLAETMTVAYVPVERNRDADMRQLVAASVGVLEPGSGDVVERTVDSIGEQQMLIALDGCEHVIDELPELVSELLRRCPNLAVLVTSREGLFIAGEHLVHVAPLPHGSDSPADALFADRAGLVLDELDPDEAAHVTTIGEKVSGIPLALELVAAKHRTTSLVDIVAGLDSQMTLLEATRRANPSHLTFAATLDFGYGSLEPDLRRVFRHVGVFRSGVPPNGLRAVAEVDEVEALLQALVDVSLLEPRRDADRHPLLEPIRQFAEGLLAEAGELDGARLRHAEWTAAFWREAYDVFQHDAAQRYYDLLHAHGAEAIAVAEWAMDTGRPDIAVSIVASVGRKWSGLLDSAPLAAVALRALDHPDVTRGAEYVRALANATWSYRVLDRDLALRLLERLEAVAPAVTDVEAKAAATEMLAIVPQVVENLGLDEDLVTESLRRFDEFLGYLGELGRPQGPHLYNRIIFLHEVGRFGEAKQEFERMRDWALGADPKEWIGVVHHEGTLAAIAGRFAEAAESLAEASRLGSETDDPVSVMESERDLIGVLARAGRSEEALEAMARYNENAALVGWPPVEEFNPDVVAPVFANLGRWDAFETVLRRWVEASVPLRANERSWQAFLEGRYVVPSRVVHLLVPVAEWLLATGRESEAATLLASAPMAFESTKFPFWEAIGEVARAEQLRKGVGVAEGLGSLEEVFGVVAELVR